MSELENLRAEVERLRGAVAYGERALLEAAMTLDDYLLRAEAAEARIKQVEGLRDKWLAVDVPSAEVTSWSHYAGEALRAALAASLVPTHGIYDPDCTCGLPSGHDGECS